MKKKLIALALAAALLTTAVLAVAGSEGDPFVTLSYLVNTYLVETEQAVTEQVQNAMTPTEQVALDRLAGLNQGYLERAENRLYADRFTRMTVSAGSRLELTTGVGLLYEAGKVELSFASGCLVDVTDGSTVTTGGTLKAGHRYIAVEDTAGSLFVISDAAYLSLQGYYDIESAGKPESPFVDITPTDWYHAAVCFAYDNELFNGVTATTFSPNTNMNRAMLATVLSRMAGVDPALSPSAGFTDVPDGVWYTTPINWAAASGIVTGISATTYAPMTDVTREQMAVMLYRYAGDYLGLDVSVSGDLSGYTDANKVASWAKDGVTWAVDRGIITGVTTTTLVPQGNATRAQVATMLQRFTAQLY